MSVAYQDRRRACLFAHVFNCTRVQKKFERTEKNMTGEKEFYQGQYGKISSETLPPRLIKVRKIFSKYRARRILDIGMGDGGFSVILKETVHAEGIYGVDISEKAVQIANKKGIKASKANLNINPLPFKDEYFQAIHCGEVIEHLFDPDYLLDELYRVLKKNGILVITSPNLASWHGRIELLLGYQPYAHEVSLRYNVGRIKRRVLEGATGHIRSHTKKSLEELLRIHSFEVLALQGSFESSGFFPFPLNLIDRVFSFSPSFSDILIATARKE